MRKFLSVLALILLLVSITLPAFAYSVPDNTIVYVTPTGKCYHRENCSYTTTVKSMTILNAEERGYRACSRCDPDDLVGEYGSSSTSRSSQSSSSKRYLTPEEREERIEETKPSFLSIVGDIAEFVVLSGIGILMLLMYAPLVLGIVQIAFDSIKDFFSKK